MISLFTTPLTPRHLELGAKCGPFAGWNMPIHYAAGIVAEHLHTRSKAGLFDICHMGEFFVDGPGAAESLARAVTVNIGTLKPGRCRYGFLLNEQGGILDDLIVYRLGEERFMLVVNAGCRDSDFARLGERLDPSLTLEDRSDITGKLDLQGPESFAVLERVLPGPWRRLPYFGFTEDASFDNAPLLVSRTGYTGELGVELYCPAEKVEKLWDRLLSDKSVLPVGLGARDTLRLEVGLPLNGRDLDEKHSPAEAGYSAMLTSQANFTGREGALRVKEKLTALRLQGRRSARHDDAVLLEDKQVGTVTSASFAPSVGSAVALAYINAEDAGATDYVIRAARTDLPARACALPFYTKGTARMTLV
jgi:aminomethyltransferase